MDLAVLDVTDDLLVADKLGQDFAASREAALGKKVEPVPLVHASQGIMFALAVRGDPDVRHPAAVDEILR